MLNPKAMLVVACVAALAACSNDDHQASSEPEYSKADIAKVSNVKSSFGPDFKTQNVGPTGIDPRLLERRPLPPGITFKPPECEKSAAEQVLPQSAKGNMAAVMAEGEGNRYVAIAVETDEKVAVHEPDPKCQKVEFSGGAVSGLVEVVDAPQIPGIHTSAIHRVLTASAAGKPPRTGDLYNYLATFGNYIVIVTANPLVPPNQPVVPINVQRARDVFTAAVNAVKG
jgi:hypothetical protein